MSKAIYGFGGSDSVLKTTMTVLLTGLEGAGKSTMHYKFRMTTTVDVSTPQPGFEVETSSLSNIVINAFDVGKDKAKNRPFWRPYFEGVRMIIFVVDVTDLERMDEAREELNLLLNQFELRKAGLLVCANKIDVRQDLTPGQLTRLVADKLSLHNIRDRDWEVFPTDCSTGAQMLDAWTWIQNELLARLPGKTRSTSR